MVTALMLPLLTKVGILIDFKINQDFIAKVLCINREKPKSTCHGQCYLSEQLKKTEEQEEKQAPTNKKQQIEIVYFCSASLFDLLPSKINFAGKINPACIDKFFTSFFIAAIFHPPKLNLR